jgi:hypothetical protein
MVPFRRLDRRTPMPLKDHFTPESDVWCQWHSFQVQWACGILSHLNLNVLDADHIAGQRVHKQHPEDEPLGFEPPIAVDTRFPGPIACVHGEFIEPTAFDVEVRNRVYERTAAVVCLAGTEFTQTRTTQKWFCPRRRDADEALPASYVPTSWGCHAARPEHYDL